MRQLRPIELQDRRPSKISPMELGLVEQPTRPRSEYTAGARREAIMAADGGQLSLAADLTRAAMTEDGYARGVIGTLTEGLWGLPMTFLGDPRQIAALSDTPSGLGQWAEMFPQPEAIKLMSWGINLGVGLGQMRPKYQEPGETIISLEEAADGRWKVPAKVRPIGAHSTRVLRTWDPKYLRNQWWDDTWWLQTADGEIRITPNDGEWLLYMPFGCVKPWEYGAWKALTLAFVLGRDGAFDRSRHAEVLAPVRVGKVPQGTTERQRKLFLQQIREMQRLHAFVLPPGLAYTIVESTGHINDIYKQIIDWQERQYCLIYTGNETTTKGTPGFSQGDVQERIQKSKLQSFSGSLSRCLRDGGLIEWSVDNYGTTDAPLAKFDCDPPEDKLAKAKTVAAAGESLTAMTAGLATTGLRITVASATAYAQSFGFAVEPLPVAAPVATEAESPIAQGDLAKALRADEIRRLAGLPPFGDERGDMVLSALNAPPGGGPPGFGAPPAAPEAPALPPVATVAESDSPPTDEAAAALAAKMTLHGVARCEHNSSNRCRLCGVERTRDFDAGAGPSGEHVWRVAWRPIGSLSGPLAAPAVSALAAGYNPDQDRADDGKFGSGGGGSASGSGHEKHDRVASAHDAHEDASAEVEESAARMAAAKEASAKNAEAHKAAEAKLEQAEADHGAAEAKLEKEAHVHSLLVESEADPEDVKDAADRVAVAQKNVDAAESALAAAEESRDAAQDAIDSEDSYGHEEHEATVTAAYHAETEQIDAKIDANAGTPQERLDAYDKQHEKAQKEYIANAKAQRTAVADHAEAEKAYAVANKSGDDAKEATANDALAAAETALSLANAARDRSRQRRDHWVTRASEAVAKDGREDVAPVEQS